MDGASRVDVERVRRELGASAVARADPDLVRDTTGYAIGGVPPFGHRTRTTVLADRGLLEHPVVWARPAPAHGVPDGAAGPRRHGGRPGRRRTRTRVTPLVAAAVVLAAVSHAVWNALAHHIRDQLVSFTLISGGGAVLGAVVAAAAPLPAAGAWPWLVLSAAVHVGYMALLMRSFTLGDFGQVYPVARARRRSRCSSWRRCSSTRCRTRGSWRVWRWPARGCWAWRCGGAAVPGPAAVGRPVGGRRHGELAIAAYSVVDGVGVRASGSPLGYIAWLMLLQGLAVPAYAVYRRRGLLAAQLRPHAGRGLLGAVMAFAAYGLVLWAQTRAPLAPIAALRESSVIVGAGIGALFFKERFGAARRRGGGADGRRAGADAAGGGRVEGGRFRSPSPRDPGHSHTFTPLARCLW